MEETLEGSQGPPRAVVPLGMGVVWYEIKAFT